MSAPTPTETAMAAPLIIGPDTRAALQAQALPSLIEYDAALDAGRIAYLAGQPVTDCPYEDGPAREGWLDGYHG